MLSEHSVKVKGKLLVLSCSGQGWWVTSQKLLLTNPLKPQTFLNIKAGQYEQLI